VLDQQLERTGAYVAGDDYSIADMAIFPWVRIWKAQQVPLDDFAHVKAWYEGLRQRPAVRRGIDAGKELRANGLDDEARKALFGQTAQTLRDAAHNTP
jgi:GST-like protein